MIDSLVNEALSRIKLKDAYLAKDKNRVKS